MPTVTFELPVLVDESFVDEDMSDEEIVDLAREILYSAPAWDGLNEDTIVALENPTVER